MDRWDRKTDFGCNSCMFYVPKKEHRSHHIDSIVASASGETKKYTSEEGRCRRLAPTMKGYPVVFADDWCGEHKRGSNPIRDASPTTNQPLAFDPERTIPTANEEKVKIKEEILGQITIVNNFSDFGPEYNQDIVTNSSQKIKELLEKL